MRFLKVEENGGLSVTQIVGNNIPPYAILSHTWGADHDEVTFKDVVEGTGKTKEAGYRKILFCRKQAANDRLQYFWIDTCCIDKSSSAELAEAINSMFRWYREAAKCYVYLSDISTGDSRNNPFLQQTWKRAFQRSRWFARGWTLQELLAPTSVEFFSAEGDRLGSRIELLQEIHDTTSIPIQALQGNPLSHFSVDERMSWAASRKTKREEDAAYCLLGIFDIHMPLIYGEGRQKALNRLLKEIKDNVPCVVIGVCDYVDCHKDKKWQNYAVAMAAACMKAFLETWTPTVKPVRNGRWGFTIKLSLCFSLMMALLIIPIAYHKWDNWMPMTQNLREDAGQVLGSESYWTVPFGRNKDFVGRGSELVRLVEQLQPDLPEDDCQRIALVGLGGVGKTQIALEASFRIRERCPDCSVFWVPATDTTSFEGAYRDIGRKLQVEGIEGDDLDVKLLVKAALSHARSGRWLLIVDNADDMELLYGGAEATNDHNTISSLARYLPSSGKGSILFTTRNRKAAVKLAGKNLVTVDAMSRHDALELLETSLAEKHMMRDTGSTTQLLDLLTDLPLAIRQASAYMNENQISTTTYLEIYRSDGDEMIHLLSQDFEESGRYKNVKNPIAMTWLVSFHQILRYDALAADYLRFMCLLAEQGIPRSLLAPAPKARMAEAIGTLKAYAFLTEREDSGSYDIHRLVQVSMRNWLKERGEWNVWITKALQQLANEFPFPVHENRDVWIRYLPHAHHILELYEHSNYMHAGQDLLFKVGHSYRIIGNYEGSENVYRQTLERKQTMLGKEHPDTLNSMNNLAVVLGDQGKHKEAEQICWQTLELKEKVLGKQHPDTLLSMNNLASELGNQGKHEEAEEMYRQTLELMEKVLGREHPDILISMNNLASELGNQGKHEEAEEMYRQTLALMEKVLGTEHPDTLISMNNLAVVLGDQGKHKEAEQICWQTLELKEKVLGKQHPDTLLSINNLASELGNQGKHEEAEEMYRQTLERKEKVLGKEHPDTPSSMYNLAMMSVILLD